MRESRQVRSKPPGSADGRAAPGAGNGARAAALERRAGAGAWGPGRNCPTHAGRRPSPAPALGEHTEKILTGDLGLAAIADQRHMRAGGSSDLTAGPVHAKQRSNVRLHTLPTALRGSASTVRMALGTL